MASLGTTSVMQLDGSFVPGAKGQDLSNPGEHVPVL